MNFATIISRMLYFQSQVGVICNIEIFTTLELFSNKVVDFIFFPIVIFSIQIFCLATFELLADFKLESTSTKWF